MVVVVLPTPPFWLHIATMRAGPWRSSRVGSGKTGIGRPVGPTGRALGAGTTSRAAAASTISNGWVLTAVLRSIVDSSAYRRTDLGSTLSSGRRPITTPRRGTPAGFQRVSPG